MNKATDSWNYIPYNPRLKDRARELRKNMAEPEKRLWFFLRDQKVAFLRQKPLDNYIVDFYCPSRRLVIEVDGDSHYNEEAERYDQRRTESLGKYNLTVLRFTNTEVMENFEEVCNKIAGYINPPNPL
jgi:very-short-patch-repair endonuclease